MSTIISFIIGTILGSVFGISIVCLMRVAGGDDNEKQELQTGNPIDKKG